MTPTRLRVGQRVVALNAYGKLKPAEVRPVPRDYRDRSGDDASTSRGDFPKAWLYFAETKNTVPWPLEDIFDDLEAAERKRREREDPEVREL